MEINITEILSNFGFPAFIAVYTLHGVNKTLNKLTDAVSKLTVEVKTIGGVCNANHIQQQHFQA